MHLAYYDFLENDSQSLSSLVVILEVLKNAICMSMSWRDFASDGGVSVVPIL